ncbi:MAG TPA: polar amino acid ABC transporter ATP-binding protein [Candidatus Omnitrophica bacterium]|nr:polar amino acid ABC transporter ATP-binding protein [Candidatus Omnitrophota bacterium]
MLPYIKVKNLGKSYGKNEIIRDLSLDINSGEVIVFKGPSGIGKSTLLRSLTYLEPFQKGSIEVGNYVLNANLDRRKERETIRAVRTQLGFVFQFFNLFPHLTVIENLTLAPIQVLRKSKEEALEDAQKLLKKVGLEEKANFHPEQLSGGQRQRVGIARALAMKPKAILFDEPTSSLDPEMKGEIVRAMSDLASEGMTMLIVTHEPAVVEGIASRIVSFGAGLEVLSDSAR